MKRTPLFVRAEWDDEGQVWVATSDDVPGLATEERTMELLIKKLRVLIPELLELNQSIGRKNDIAFEMLSRRFETVHVAHA